MFSGTGAVDGAEDPWKSFLISTFTFAGVAAGGGVEAEAGVEAPLEGGALDTEGLPFTWPGPAAAGTDPNDLTFSVLTAGALAGEEDMEAESSSIDPNVTAEACFTVPTELRGTLTPSFMGTAWPRILGFREWVPMAGGVEVPGAGDCERGVDAVDPVFGGGPLAQADFEGATVGIFCAVAVEGLLIEFCKRPKDGLTRVILW